MDGYITKDDVKLILSHVPVENLHASNIETKKHSESKEEVKGLAISETEIKEDFEARVASQKELDTLAETCFKRKLTLSCDEFGYIIEYIDSGMFLCLLSLLRTHFPSLTEFKRYNMLRKLDSPNTTLQKRKLAASKVLSKFAPVSKLLTPNLTLGITSLATTKEVNKESKSTKDQLLSPVLASHPAAISAIRLPNAKQDSIDVTRSPSAFLRKNGTEDQLLFCQCGHQITDFDLLLCDDCKKTKSEEKLEGFLYIRQKKTRKMAKRWFIIEQKVIYCYKSKTDKEYKNMHTLTGCFLKDENPEKMDDKSIMYPFTLCFGSELAKKYYCTSKVELNKWSNIIKHSIGYSNVTDYYTIKV